MLVEINVGNFGIREKSNVVFWALNGGADFFWGALSGCDWRFFVKLGKMGKDIWRSGKKSVIF